MDANECLANDSASDDELILVDGLDRQTGTASKKRIHVEGLLHRAFSVIVLRDGPDGPETLLAQRADCKYHSAGLWANSCCSHPRKGEKVLDAARRRVREELGCELVEPEEVSAFAYRACFENGLCEYEYDHVIVGRFGGGIEPDEGEVSAVRWVGFDELASELAAHPDRFAAWAPMVLTMAMAHVARRG